MQLIGVFCILSVSVKKFGFGCDIIISSGKEFFD